MKNLIEMWKKKAEAIRNAVHIMSELEQSIADESDMGPDTIMLKREEIKLREDIMSKQAVVYEECAKDLENKLWEV